MAFRRRLGDILIADELIDEEQLNEGLKRQRETGEKLGQALMHLGHVTPEQIADALSEHLQIPRANLSRRYIQNDAVELVPDDMLRSRELLPVERDGDSLLLAMVDPLNILAIDDLQRMTGLHIKPVIATAQEIEDAMQRSTDFASTARRVVSEYDSGEEEQDTQEDPEEYLGDAPGVRLTNMMLTQAVRQKASDVHLEPREDRLRVRFRVDGVLRDVMNIPRRLMADVTSRVKIMANLDITERRRPQDGRIQTELDGDIDVDMRISTLPTVYGEKIVARLLNTSQGVMDIDAFGFSEDSMHKIERMLRQSQGMILVTGPTGSGKTTTLYGFLQQLNQPDVNIITVEDPVEYELEGISQVPVNHKVGLTFSTGLRSVLRQDPDIIMVGEIRDHETAEIAVRSALTGHLVLSTLHTNSAAATISRLMDMGMESYLLSSTIIGVMAQRLVRLICPDCKEQVRLEDPLMKRFIRSLGLPVPTHVYQGKGCPFCKDTGYRGRAALEELLVVGKAMRDAIDERLTDSRLQEIAVAGGMRTLSRRAVDKLIAGDTTVEEVIRTVYSVEDEEDLEEAMEEVKDHAELG